MRTIALSAGLGAMALLSMMTPVRPVPTRIKPRLTRR